MRLTSVGADPRSGCPPSGREAATICGGCPTEWHAIILQIALGARPRQYLNRLTLFKGEPADEVQHQHPDFDSGDNWSGDSRIHSRCATGTLYFSAVLDDLGIRRSARQKRRRAAEIRASSPIGRKPHRTYVDHGRVFIARPCAIHPPGASIAPQCTQ